jgi:ATP-binding cassette subfamily B protein
MKRLRTNRRLLAPEVIQSSGMDCGPASLKCLLDGHYIPVSYGRLREACQTDVDGTSIDTLEEVAVQLGLPAEQIMVPADHLLLTEAQALPALVVVRLPNGNTHFVVVWRCVGPWVQIMDPATGRRWSTRQQFLDELYLHMQSVPASAWREWAATDDFLTPLRARLRQLGLMQQEIATLVDNALADPDWRSLAALDATIRLVTAIIRARGLRQQRTISALVTQLYQQARLDAIGATNPVPTVYWSVQPIAPTQEEEAHLALKGAVLVRIASKQQQADEHLPDEGAEVATQSESLSPELQAALAEPTVRPSLALLRMLWADGMLAPLALLLALALAAFGITLEALLFRSLMDIGVALQRFDQRLLLFGAVMFLLVTNLLVEVIAVSAILRFGRRLEARLRMAFLAKIPRLNDRYFQSRLTSDMAERSHNVHRLRILPTLASGLLRASFTLIFTTIGLLWLNPDSMALTLLAACAAVTIPLVTQPVLMERDLRVRSHLGALSRFYLDGLLGLVAIRVHNAERAVRREHENLLIEWIKASWRFHHTVVISEGL